MHRTALLVPAMVLGALASSCAAPPPRSPDAPSAGRAHAIPPGPVHHVVVISIDGLMPDAYLHPDAHGLKVPTLRKLYAEGAGSTGVEGVFPSVTYPSHTSMVTGVNPARHGIMSNRSYDPEENDLEGWRWYAEDIKAEPIWRTAERAGYRVGMVHWPVSVGADVSFRVPEYWRAGNDNDKKVLRAVSTPGLLDAVTREHPDFFARYSPPGVHDDALADIATYLIAKERPELLFLHLIEVDDRQHHYGVWSSEAKASIENDDQQVARVLAALDGAGIGRDTSLIVLSDHGFLDAPSGVRPGALLREAGLTPEIPGKDWKVSVLVSGGQAYVYVRDPRDIPTAAAVKKLFEAKAAESGSGISRVYDAREIAARGGDPKALLALDPAPGFQFVPGVRGPYADKPFYMATHGFDPKSPAMQASMLMRGPTIPHGTIEDARLIDVAPTVAAMLGLTMPSVEGRVLHVVPAK